MSVFTFYHTAPSCFSYSSTTICLTNIIPSPAPCSNLPAPLGNDSLPCGRETQWGQEVGEGVGCVGVWVEGRWMSLNSGRGEVSLVSLCCVHTFMHDSYVCHTFSPQMNVSLSCWIENSFLSARNPWNILILFLSCFVYCMCVFICVRSPANQTFVTCI